MTNEEAQAAAAKLAGRIRTERPELEPMRLADGRGLAHALFMLEEIVRGMSENKAMRWLGYAQAVLVYEDFMALGDAKEANRAAVYDGKD